MKVRASSEVLVVGAGPVGLFSALCLAERGIGVQVIDREHRDYVHGYSLVLHPHTLRMLDEHGLARGLLTEGQRIERMALYDQGERVGAVEFGLLPGTYPFALALPQSRLEAALRRGLADKKVHVFGNHEASSIEASADSVTLTVGKLDKVSLGYPIARTEWMVEKEYQTQARFVIGADGPNSFVRGAVGVDFERYGPTQKFAVFELPYRMQPVDEAQVVFHGDTIGALWPVNATRARWSFQLDAADDSEADIAALRRLHKAHAPWQAQEVETVHWATVLRFGRRLASRFGGGRIWLAGDAAHVTGPVGVQSLNVGLREAHDLAERLSAAIKESAPGDVLERYEAEQRHVWGRLLGIAGKLELMTDAAPWVVRRAQSLLACIPASGEDLDGLLAQLRLRLTS